MDYFDTYKTFLKSKYNYDVEIRETQIIDENEQYVYSLIKNGIEQANIDFLITNNDKNIEIGIIKRENEGEKGTGKKLLYLISALAADKGYTLTFSATPILGKERYNLSHKEGLKQLIKYYNSLGFNHNEKIPEKFYYKTSTDKLKSIVNENMKKGGSKTRKRKTKTKKSKSKSKSKSRKHRE